MSISAILLGVNAALVGEEMKTSAKSKDGLLVSINVQRKTNKEIEAVITGGEKEFRTHAGEGFYIEVKSEREADPNLLSKTVASEITEATGKHPTIMPPSYSSGLIVFIVNDVDATDEEELKIAYAIVGVVGRANLRRK